MDHHGLLTVTRSVSVAMHELTQEREVGVRWDWNATPLIFPESRCPYCQAIIRSQYIWFLRGDRLNMLVGAFKVEAGKPIKLERPVHPHSIGSERFCLGSHYNGAALFAHGPNLRDLPLGPARTALWVNKYWGPHYCKELEDVIIRYDTVNRADYKRSIIKP